MSSEYFSVPSTGKLKIKGVKDSKIEKTKKKKKSKKKDDPNDAEHPLENESSVLKLLEDEDKQIRKDDRRKMGIVDGKEVAPGAGIEDPETSQRMKTDAERRHEEQRRKRLEERLKREGVKTHKQRVEDLNRYLSSLSEHHDMPRIGPG